MTCHTNTAHKQLTKTFSMPYLGLSLTISTCFQSFLIGIVVPDAEMLPEFAAKLGVKGSFEELCKNPVSGFVFSGLETEFNSKSNPTLL